MGNTIVLMLFFVLWLHVRPSLRAAVSDTDSRRLRGLDSKTRRNFEQLGQVHLVHQVNMILALAFAYYRGGWNWKSVGGGSSWLLPIAVSLGFCLYVAGLWIEHVIYTRLNISETISDAAFAAMRNLWPRHRREKYLAVLSVCVLNPATEELVYRGVLVYSLATFLGSVSIAIAVGFVLCLGAHAYQGIQLVIGHAVMFALATALLFSPLGLGGAIGLHVASDLLPVLYLRRAMLKWRMRQVAKRKNAAFYEGRSVKSPGQ